MLVIDAKELDTIDGQIIAIKGHRSRAERVGRQDLDAVRIAIDEGEDRHAGASAHQRGRDGLWPIVGDALD